MNIFKGFYRDSIIHSTLFSIMIQKTDKYLIAIASILIIGYLIKYLEIELGFFWYIYGVISIILIALWLIENLKTAWKIYKK